MFRQILGERFSEYYATSRAWELKAWRETVTDWERERYERARIATIDPASNVGFSAKYDVAVTAVRVVVDASRRSDRVRCSSGW